jgi:hypothetical protein
VPLAGRRSRARLHPGPEAGPPEQVSDTAVAGE